jgi:hypothetical protein
MLYYASLIRRLCLHPIFREGIVPPPPPPPGLTSHIHVYGVIRQLHKLVRTLDDVLAW